MRPQDVKGANTALIITAGAILFGAFLLFWPEPKHSNKPKPAQWERQAWESSKCDLCKRPMTSNPQDGLYTIGEKAYWVHGDCFKTIMKAKKKR